MEISEFPPGSEFVFASGEISSFNPSKLAKLPQAIEEKDILQIFK